MTARRLRLVPPDPDDPHAPGRRSPEYEYHRDTIAALKRGEAHVYHRDGLDRQAGAFAAAWDAMERGAATLAQRRNGGRLEYIAIRR